MPAGGEKVGLYSWQLILRQLLAHVVKLSSLHVMPSVAPEKA
jgi:hypothetical protein